MHKLAQALLVTSLITGNAAWAAPHRECLATLLIRNFNEAPLERLVREPLYDALSARLAPGTAAEKLGISVDTVAPGKRSCPYHFLHAQEELLIVIEGEGTLRVAG